MRDVTEEMRNAPSDLRRQDPAQASERAARALEQLRDARAAAADATPDERRRALGDLQLEARQLADAERQIASELSQRGARTNGQDDALRGWPANRSGSPSARGALQDGLRAG